MSDILYPQHLDIIDPRFRQLVLPNSPLHQLHTGSSWTEGPVWFGDHGSLLWSDIPNNRMLRWSETGVSVFRQPSNFANGNTRDRQGRLLTCEHGTRRVTRTEYDGTIRVLADCFDGVKLNSPNDVVVKSDGTVWFSDPSYGIDNDYEGYSAPPEYGGCHLFCFDPRDGTLRAAATDFEKPNGLAFSLDERTLYVVDTGGTHVSGGPHHIRALRVGDDNRVAESRLFAEVAPGFPDGLRLDRRGNIWTSAGDGVHCYTPEGTLLGKVLVPEVVSNVCFGGARLNRLFITATSSLYAVHLNVSGAAGAG
jgi:gluconolactonase